MIDEEMILEKILIIDDSESDHYLAQRVIRKYDQNIEIVCAYDGQEALDLLSNMVTPPDVILLDINMPRMNGHEFLAKYNTWEKLASPVIILTSSNQQKDIDQSGHYKCVIKYLTKPLEELANWKIRPLSY